MIKMILLALMLVIPSTAEAIDKSRAHPRGWNPNQGCGSAGGRRSCHYECTGIGAFGRCVGSWRKVCGEWKCNRRTGELSGATEFSAQWGRYRHDRRKSAWEERQKPFREAMLRKRRQQWLYNNLWAVKARNVGCPAGHVCRSKPTPYPF